MYYAFLLLEVNCKMIILHAVQDLSSYAAITIGAIFEITRFFKVTVFAPTIKSLSLLTLVISEHFLED